MNIYKGGGGGAYTATIQDDFVAGIIDWKGKTRTEDAQGNPFDPPVTDVLTWKGPTNRYGPRHGGVLLTNVFAYKDGAKYFRAPLFDNSAGNSDPENDPNNNLSHGQVLGAAIQQDADGNRRDVLITDFQTTVGGAQNIGEATWYVWWRQSNSGLASNAWNDPPDPNDVDFDPTKWSLIASFPAPITIAVDRYERSRMWFFNRSGTQASMMMPDNTFGDLPSASLDVPVVNRLVGSDFTNAPLNLIGVNPQSFPYYLRLVSINVDAFAMTASISVSAREPGHPVRTITTQLGACSASGTLTFECVTFTAAGGFSSNRTVLGGSTISNPGPWRIAVDYKGDNMVFAEISILGTGGTSSTFYSISESAGQPTTATGGATDIYNVGYKLSAGALQLVLSEDNASFVANESNSTRTHTRRAPNGSDSVFRGPFLNPDSQLLWLDLREDYAVFATQAFAANHVVTAIGGELRSAAGGGSFTLPNPNAVSHGIFYSSSSGNITASAFIQAWRGVNLVAEYRFDEIKPASGGLSVTGIGGTQFSTILESFPQCAIDGDPFFSIETVDAVSCTQPSTSSMFDIVGPVSLESLARFDNIVVQPTQLNTEFLQIATAIDTARNIALSMETYSQLVAGGHQSTSLIVSSPGAVVVVPASEIPDNPIYLNHLTGDDLITVSNQVSYTDPGLDGIRNSPSTPSGDDVALPPVDTVTGRAQQNSIKIL